MYGMYLRCTRDNALRILRPLALLPATDEYGGYDPDTVRDTVTELGISLDRLCSSCFPDLNPTFWQKRYGQSKRTLTVSADAAAVIALAVKFTTEEPGPFRPRQGTNGPRTVTLSGHADAVIAGLVGPPDLGDSTVIDDRERVWLQGINASEKTWAEIHDAFPLSLAEECDLAKVDTDTVWQEIRQTFPLSTFRTWADQSMRFKCMIDHFYDPEAGL